MYKLLIVESPNKIQKITKYLKEAFPSQNWRVAASVGHVDDLTIGKGINGLGIEDFNNFKPIYGIAKGKSKIVKKLKDLVKSADETYLAMDPDREGEAIAKRLQAQLKLKENYKRVTFSEISPNAIKKAINSPRKIDEAMVNAQEARRILDRLVGFEGTKIAKSRVGNIRALGRVQTPTVALVAKRNEEISNFVPQKYESLEVTTNIDNNLTTWNIKLIDEENDKYASPDFKNKELMQFKDIDELKDLINNNDFVVKLLGENEVIVGAPSPLTTSKLLQKGSKLLKISTKEVMKLLQSLFEKGYLTYIRTDSTHIDPEWVESQRKYLLDNGLPVVSGDIKGKSNAVNAQEAHEAIRPINLTVKDIDGSLNEKELYKFIYDITTLALLEPGVDTKAIISLNIKHNNDLMLTSTVITDQKLGWRKHAGMETKVDVVSFEHKQIINKEDVIVKKSEKVTSPPTEYTEASLISAMEKLGIGRPSTYSATIDNIINNHKYIVNDAGKLVTSEEGLAMIKVAYQELPDLFQFEYTASLEKSLNDISMNRANKKNLLSIVWDLLSKSIAKTSKIAPEGSKGSCPECKIGFLIERKGKFGTFIGCNRYPECKYIQR